MADTIAIVSFFYAFAFYFEKVPALGPVKFDERLLCLLLFTVFLPWAAYY